jgi:hypothetical protein
MKSGLFTFNVRLPSLSPVVTVATNVQVEHKEPAQNGVNQDIMESENADWRKDGYEIFDDKTTESETDESIDLSKSSIPSYTTLPVHSGATCAKLKAGPKSPNNAIESGSAYKHQQGTYLQQHCAYFDPDGDGVIWPWNTYRGCRNFGWGCCMSSWLLYPSVRTLVLMRSSP